MSKRLHASMAEEKKEDFPLPSPKARNSGPSEAVPETLNSTRMSSAKQNAKKGYALKSVGWSVLRFVCMDLVVMAPLAVFCAMKVLETVKDNYLLKQMELQEWTAEKQMSQITYYDRQCVPESITAHDTPELIIDPAEGTQVAVEKMMIHGASVYPNLLRPETAKELRDFIVTENKRTTDVIPVLAQAHRWSFPIQVDQHPSVSKALKEILSKDYLVDAIEGIMGPNPAVIEFTGITSAYGAMVQNMHQDVVPDASAAKFNRNYAPSYSLFIPLQNTTKAMGATEVCPGTHQIAVGCSELCEEEAFHVSGSADNWPMGYGALVNQQTTHRGPAHTGRGQPERVLFILTFAPRPRYDAKQVETRMLGSGGSYSLHWSQWGHTLRDFADPDRRMTFFWRHLKSLGIYKPWGHEWGWDYTTVASQRMVGEEQGFNADDLGSQYKKGKFDWLPRFLHGSVLETDDPVQVWTTFLIETAENVKNFAKTCYLNGLYTYLAILIGGNALLHLTGFISDSHVRAVQCIRRVALTHGGIVLAALLYYRSVARGSWARNISKGLHLQGPDYNFGPMLPMTLPNEYDVLVFDELQAPFLASTAFVYDYTHPGNFRWMGLTNSHARGFDLLTPELKSHLCGELIEWQAAEHNSRILVKNVEMEWSVATEELANRFCHKSLLSIDNHLKKFAIKWIDFLISEVRFGFWRDTVMNMKHMEPWLTRLQNDVMGFQWPSGNKTDVLVVALDEPSPQSPFATRLFGNTPRMPETKPKARSPLPPSAFPEEPYEGAWLQQGDVVEANYHGYSGEYYRATILGTVATTNTWEVVYDDGEEALDLCPTCVRPFVPYQVGDKTDYRDRKNHFVPGRIIAVDGEDTYQVQLENGRRVSRVSASSLRRVPDTDNGRSMAKGAVSYKVGARVHAEYPGASGLFPGVIQEVHGDGYFSILYDDGDFSDEVHKSMIHA